VVLPKKFLGSVAGRNADSVLPKLFSGEKDLAKPRLIFLHFVRAEEGSGEESARVFWNFYSGDCTRYSYQYFYPLKNSKYFLRLLLLF